MTISPFWDGTPEQNAPRNSFEARCDATHGGIIVGRAGANDEGTFGHFAATQPVGAELLSVSGWICRWTGEYAMSNGHWSGILERVRHTDGRAVADSLKAAPVFIHACSMNAWTATGRYSFADGTVVDVQHGRGQVTPRCSAHGNLSAPQSFRERAGRELVHHVAADHARVAHAPVSA
jgi:hypothetical protein